MKLIKSISILNNAVLKKKINEDIGCIQINSGTMSCQGVDSPIPYRDSATIPKQDWRSLSDQENAILLDDYVQASGIQIGIVKFPSDALIQLQSLGLTQINDREDVISFSKHESYAMAVYDCFEYIFPYIEDLESINISKLGFQQKNLYTTTEAAPGLLLGLHLDHWSAESLLSRAATQNRICLNIGESPRYFQFINLSMEDIFSLCLKERFIDKTDEANIHLIVDTFFKQFSSYPVVRIKLDPGEAYISPTENIIHDGSSLGQLRHDMNLTIRGLISQNIEGLGS